MKPFKPLAVLLFLSLLLGSCSGASTPAKPTGTLPPVLASLVAPTSLPALTLPPGGTAQATMPPAAPTAAAASATLQVIPTRLQPVVLPTAWDDRSLYAANLVPDQQGILEGLPGASVYHIDLTIDDSLVSLNGKEEILYTNREKAPLQELYLRLFPNLVGGTETLANLTVNDAPVTPLLEQQDSAVKIPLEKPLGVGEQVVLRLDFNLRVPGADASNFDVLGYAAHVLSLATFYPIIPAYDAQGWHIEIPAPYGDQTYSDTAFYEVRVSAPSGQKVVASGAAVATQPSGNRTITTYAAGPVRDFYLAASDWFVESHETVGNTLVHSYAFNQLQSSSAQALVVAKAAFDSYEKRFGEYPYSQFSLAATPTKALGVEYPQVVVIATGLYDLNSPLGAARPQYFESTVAHEIAHQWFYGVVGNDQVNQPWLDEAMAQYATYLYYEDAHGDVAAGDFQTSWEQRWERVNRADIPIGLPTTAYTADSYGAIVYGRGPIFINLLARDMGAEPWSVFLKDYYKDYMWGDATTSGYEALAQQVCGCDLKQDFQAWVGQ